MRGHHNIRGKTHAKDAIRRANALLTTLSHLALGGLYIPTLDQ